jgi:sigma-B regulation protein RsbU (phosphoserine phosphatase)
MDAERKAWLRHEMGNPINQIIGYSEMLMEQAEEDGKPDYLPDLNKIRDAAQKLLTLINAHLSSGG